MFASWDFSLSHPVHTQPCSSPVKDLCSQLSYSSVCSIFPVYCSLCLGKLACSMCIYNAILQYVPVRLQCVSLSTVCLYTVFQSLRCARKPLVCFCILRVSLNTAVRVWILQCVPVNCVIQLGCSLSMHCSDRPWAGPGCLQGLYAALWLRYIAHKFRTNVS